ncbi:MAG: glycosyltransferase family 4 protein [Bacteroidota bacterium]
MFKIGRLLAFLSRQRKYYFFFHSNKIGGAEKVHLEILDALSIPSNEMEIIFTSTTSKSGYSEEYLQYGSNVDITAARSNRRLFFLWLGFYSQKINRSQSALCFGSVSYFYYRLIPFLKSDIVKLDLIHALMGNDSFGIEHLSLPVAEHFDAVIVTHQSVAKGLKSLYEQSNIENVPIEIIPNGVACPDQYQKKDLNNGINVLYVGRYSDEKRVNLLFRAAKMALEHIPSIKFSFAGFERNEILDSIPDNCTILGKIKDRDALNAQFRKAHFIVLVSEREGMPLSVLEGMSYGCVPITTAVGSLRNIISDEVGVLIPPDCDNLHEEMFNAISSIIANPQHYHQLSKQSYQLVRNQYSLKIMKNQYKKLFEQL